MKVKVMLTFLNLKYKEINNYRKRKLKVLNFKLFYLNSSDKKAMEKHA